MASDYALGIYKTFLVTLEMYNECQNICYGTYIIRSFKYWYFYVKYWVLK